jgi:hypothetical protein
MPKYLAILLSIAVGFIIVLEVLNIFSVRVNPDYFGKCNSAGRYGDILCSNRTLFIRIR